MTDQSIFKNKGTIAVLSVVAVGVVAKAIYSTLQSNPTWAVKGYSLLNYLFDNSKQFNLNEHRFLAGPFKPVNDEVSHYPVEIVAGSIPKDLEGLFARTGPNPIPERLPHAYHWFDGDAMVHSIRVKDGKATYSNQYAETPNYLLTKQYGSPVRPQLGELHGFIGLAKIFYDKLFLSKAIEMNPLEDGVANTAIIRFQDRLFLGYESNFPFEVKWSDKTHSFTSLGFQSFQNALNYPFTAHPKVDPDENNIYFVNYSFDPELGPMKYGAMDKDFKLLSYFNINLSVPTMAHDMMITKNHVLLFDSSITFDRNGIFKGEFLTMNQNKPFRIGVLPKVAKSDKEVQWFTFDRAFALIHALNAWEDNVKHEIVLFTPLAKEHNGFDAKKPATAGSYEMYEIHLNLITGEASLKPFPTEQTDSPLFVEFPNVHPHYLGRKSHFGFSGAIHPTLRMFHQIVKFNLFENKIDGVIQLPPDWICGEPVIIPRESQQLEHPQNNLQKYENDYSDAVYLGIYATNLKTEETDWMVFDGKSMKNEPVVRIRIPGKRIPLGFHGIWIGEKDLVAHMNK